MDAEEFHYYREFIFNGAVYAANVQERDLAYIRDDLQFREDDIVVATYPKAGEWVDVTPEKPKTEASVDIAKT